MHDATQHPYTRYEGTHLWETVERAIAGLVANNDLAELTPRSYIVGYICQQLESGGEVRR